MLPSYCTDSGRKTLVAEKYLEQIAYLFKKFRICGILTLSSNAHKGDLQVMRNSKVRKVIVYAMVALMLLSSLMMGLSFVI